MNERDGEQNLHINHLIHETSPYLLQHAHNPVDWYPWGAEALGRAKAEDKPIFLSIGYAACHWCHVMEHESFENEQIAALLNEHFISVKVDREERPDLDDIYMTATVALNGSGGWPMSVWLTPELKPFYAGTYYPPVDRFGRPGFGSILTSIANAWKNKRGEVEKGAQGLSDYVHAQLTQMPLPPGTISPGLIEGAIEQLRRNFDPDDGGWGVAPKFPSSPSIALVLRAWRRTGDPQLLHMARLTLDHMARGGLYDQLGGGFHRYSVDAEWLVPHFEKMLYDNAQLSQVYLEAWQATKEPLYRTIVEEIFAYQLRDMRAPGGAFYSTEDADSEGEEGKFYVWTKAEILELLGPDDGPLFCAYYNVRDDGNFTSHETYHNGQNILHVTASPDDVARGVAVATDALRAALARGRDKLMAARGARVRPGLDDKILTSWNALMISSLAQGGRVFNQPQYIEAAADAARWLMAHMRREDGRYWRTHREGKSHLLGYLDDHAFLLSAFIDLYEATFDAAWLEEADALAAVLQRDYWDEASGLFFFTTEDHTDVLLRARPTYDGAEPSGNSVAALALQRLAILRDNAGYRTQAQRILESLQGAMAKAPQAYLRLLAAVDFALYPPLEIALVGEQDDPATRALLETLFDTYVPNKVVALRDPSNGDASRSIPLLANKPQIDGRATVYVCRNFTCDAPVTTAAELASALGSAPAGRG